jgi:hypothetical protein
MATLTCKNTDCNYTGDEATFPKQLIPNHDRRCPKCRGTALDTSELLALDSGYAWGADNALRGALPADR